MTIAISMTMAMAMAMAELVNNQSVHVLERL